MLIEIIVKKTVNEPLVKNKWLIQGGIGWKYESEKK